MDIYDLWLSGLGEGEQRWAERKGGVAQVGRLNIGEDDRGDKDGDDNGDDSEMSQLDNDGEDDDGDKDDGGDFDDVELSQHGNDGGSCVGHGHDDDNDVVMCSWSLSFIILAG